MGISPAVFNSAGQRSEHLLPGVYSRSNNVTSPTGVSTGNLCILGESQGGEPGKLLTFASLAEAKETLISGQLLEAVGYAFNAHDTYIPQRVNVIRVNPATKSSVTLKQSDAATGSDILKLTSWDWGVHCNQLKIYIENRTEDGISVVDVKIGYKDEIQEYSDIVKASVKISNMSDENSAKIEIEKDKIKLYLIDGESQEIEESSFTFKFEDFPTIDSLVARINDTEVFQAENLGNGSDVSADLDTVTKTIATEDDDIFYANFAELVSVLKSSTLIGDVEPIGVSRVVPADTDGYVYFTGGTTTSQLPQHYFNALTVLQTENIQIIATPYTNENVATFIVEHCKEMSNVINRKERTCFIGAAVGTTEDDGIKAAKGFNSKYASYIIDSAKAVNPITGVTETISGAMLGVMLAAMESSMNINEPLTFKTLNVLEFTKKRSITEIERLISYGILVCNANPENLSSYICIRAVTTYQADDLINCERSMVREDLYMNRDLRSKFTGGVGHPNDGSTSSIIQTLKDAGKDWALAGLIVKNGNDAVWNIKVRISGDKVYLTYSRYLTAPRNFVFITATNHVYETTVEL